MTTETPLSERARDALEEYRSRTGTEPVAARLQDIWRRASSDSKRSPSLLLAPAMVVGIAVLAALLTRPREVTAAAGAVWSRSSDTVNVVHGQLTLRADDTLNVTTPQLSAEMTHAVALFDVTSRSTTLYVESGEVVWRAGERRGTAVKGTRVTMPEAPTNLSTQSELYADALAAHQQGRGADAARLFREYLRRFPSGAFAPEAQYGLLLELSAQGESAELTTEAARFLVRWPDDPRAETVRRWRVP